MSFREWQGILINLQAVRSLFAVQFSERSGLVKDVKAAESILREYETATTTRFSCFKANEGFGNTGQRFSIHQNSATKNIFRLVLFLQFNYFYSTNKGIGRMRRHTHSLYCKYLGEAHTSLLRYSD